MLANQSIGYVHCGSRMTSFPSPRCPTPARVIALGAGRRVATLLACPSWTLSIVRGACVGVWSAEHRGSCFRHKVAQVRREHAGLKFNAPCPLARAQPVWTPQNCWHASLPGPARSARSTRRPSGVAGSGGGHSQRRAARRHGIGYARWWCGRCPDVCMGGYQFLFIFDTYTTTPMNPMPILFPNWLMHPGQNFLYHDSQ